MVKNILIFPCGSEIGLELKRALEFSTHFKLFGASSTDDHGEYVFENYIPGLPFVDDKNFVEKINEVIDKYKIDFIFPAHDSVILKLAQHSSELHCGIITSDVDVCEIARSKHKTYQVLKGVIPVPEEYSLQNIPKYPVFLKPDVGQGGKGCSVAYNLVDVENAIKHDPTLLLLEFLPGREYTIDCFTDKKGNLLYVQGRQRARILNGISARSMPVDRPEFIEYAKKISQKIHFDGVWFFQVKESVTGELVLMEVAPRVAGTMALSRMRGVNLPLMACFNALNIPVSVLPNKYNIEIDRALENKFKIDIEYNTIYVDFDDCIIINGIVNVSMIAFLYKAFNKHKKIILITKHQNKDINAVLKQYRLDTLFDEIIHISDTDNKYKYITNKNSIFIDDSFAERKQIYEHIQIPVFSPDMIAEML